MKLVLAIALLGITMCAYAGKVSVGPYYLGMSAAEARKAGIVDCKPWGGSTKCAATYGPLKDRTGFILLLDNKVQTVKSIELKTEVQLGKPDTHADFKPMVDVPACPAGFSDRNSCYYPPDKLITKETSSYMSSKRFDGYFRTTITAEVNRAKVVDFLREKRKKDRGNHNAGLIQYGK